ncbi:MAG TPA: peptidylprolyl isomerase [Sulfitobacter pontiacus]|uniref:peptidylprolyl isomerase n=1 Tax=Sulfitobacter TaxID=60136 RepID=UPI0000669F33|nr:MULTISPECIES: peptidylprolyl isomerase [Sulfitobacter]MAJ79392.1 peptidylprolyl isomerase [Roseobacter sp.]AXI51197.1 peptidylprolyl isomerase [Sulfitobacter sp. SK025]EAP80725.1 PPIC-type PPIASE domain protein [Sulfitobacter sp. NAS-14.1]OAN79741.1 peptidylprolyl isomerase [Sulfitobacter pontiacus]OUT35616.1 MAG: peptidylprolyl isomerase [Sulfitobacter sp. TMED3]
MNLNRLTRSIAVLGLGLMTAAPVSAQNLFAPVAKVNESVVTEFEVQQRQRFLEVLNAPGATREGALTSLIDERLRNEAVAEAGIELTPQGIEDSLAEFASRADLSTEEFTQALGQSGVSRETFRDFVVNSVGWRELVRARYASRVQITDAEINRALGETQGSGVRVLVSEIIIPAPPQQAARVNALAEQISQSKSTAEFSNYASRYSATASRGRGGRLPWQNLTDLPPSLQPLILNLAPGEVTDPLPIPNAVALFQLRDIEETSVTAPTYSEIEYAAYYIPGGRTEAALAQAAQIRGRIDTCDDLYGIAKGQPAEVLERVKKAPSDIPQDVAIELSKLDTGEVSTTLTRANGQTLMLLMMCGRTAAANASASREDVTNALRQERLTGYAEQLLEQLRADARIVRK